MEEEEEGEEVEGGGGGLEVGLLRVDVIDGVSSFC